MSALKGAEKDRGHGPLLIGLTGGIGTGKSTVAALLARCGAVVVDADQVARDVVEPGRPALADIAREFGPEYIGPDGRLRRDRMAARVFGDPEARRRLEAIVHPRIRAEMEARIAAAPPDAIVVLDVPLLFESGMWRERVAYVVVVYADRRTQRRRLRERDGLDDEAIERRLAAQWPTALKLSRADFAVYNQGDRESLAAQVCDLWKRLVALRDRGAGTAPFESCAEPVEADRR